MNLCAFICLYLTILSWIVKSIVLLGFIMIKSQKYITCVAYRLIDSVVVIGLVNHKGKIKIPSQCLDFFFFYLQNPHRVLNSLTPQSVL